MIQLIQSQNFLQFKLSLSTVSIDLIVRTEFISTTLIVSSQNSRIYIVPSSNIHSFLTLVHNVSVHRLDAKCKRLQASIINVSSSVEAQHKCVSRSTECSEKYEIKHRRNHNNFVTINTFYEYTFKNARPTSRQQKCSKQVKRYMQR